MRKIRVGINGVGRIGRTLIREWCDLDVPEFDIVALNNPGVSSTYVHLLKYDSTHGPFRHPFDWNEKDQTLTLKNHKISFLNGKTPEEIPWEEAGVDIVIDSTGKFKKNAQLQKHLGKTVKKVVLCAPGDDLDTTLVMGINHHLYNKERHHTISNASCTTNCLAPVIAVLHDNWQIEHGMMSTVHAYTSDQKLLDSSHKDLRRARGALQSIIPTSTGAARALGKVFPDLEGKLDGQAFRVPTPNVSLVDLTVQLKQKVCIEEINATYEKEANGKFKDILGIEKLGLVSSDFLGSRKSAIIDLQLTNVVGGFTKVVAWYDNEIGFSNRVLDLVKYISKDF